MSWSKITPFCDLSGIKSEPQINVAAVHIQSSGTSNVHILSTYTETLENGHGSKNHSNLSFRFQAATWQTCRSKPIPQTEAWGAGVLQGKQGCTLCLQQMGTPARKEEVSFANYAGPLTIPFDQLELQ